MRTAYTSRWERRSAVVRTAYTSRWERRSAVVRTAYTSRWRDGVLSDGRLCVTIFSGTLGCNSTWMTPAALATTRMKNHLAFKVAICILHVVYTSQISLPEIFLLLGPGCLLQLFSLPLAPSLDSSNGGLHWNWCCSLFISSRDPVRCTCTVYINFITIDDYVYTFAYIHCTLTYYMYIHVNMCIRMQRSFVFYGGAKYFGRMYIVRVHVLFLTRCSYPSMCMDGLSFTNCTGFPNCWVIHTNLVNRAHCHSTFSFPVQQTKTLCILKAEQVAHILHWVSSTTVSHACKNTCRRYTQVVYTSYTVHAHTANYPRSRYTHTTHNISTVHVPRTCTCIVHLEGSWTKNASRRKAFHSSGHVWMFNYMHANDRGHTYARAQARTQTSMHGRRRKCMKQTRGRRRGRTDENADARTHTQHPETSRERRCECVPCVGDLIVWMRLGIGRTFKDLRDVLYIHNLLLRAFSLQAFRACLIDIFQLVHYSKLAHRWIVKKLAMEKTMAMTRAPCMHLNGQNNARTERLLDGVDRCATVVCNNATV